MVAVQKVKEAEITELDSLLLTRNLLRIAIFNISYIRGLFPEKYFNDKSVPALDMKIKKLMPMDAESRRLIDWMEKGVYDALQKKYLKTLLFCVCEATGGHMIEEYAFSFSYSDSDTQEVSMNVSRSGSKKSGGTFKCDSKNEITSNQMRSSACKMVRTLVQLMRTLDKMPEERTILMKLLYYDSTPADYEPPFFRGCSEEEARNTWTKNPLKMEVGNVNSKHVILTLKVKSVLDPCEDENDENHENTSSSEGGCGERDGDSDSDSDTSMSNDGQFIVAPIEKQQEPENNTMVNEDDTQDPAEDEEQLSRVKDWINSHHYQTLNLTDIVSNFPDISRVLIEEIMDKLVKEGVISKSGADIYSVTKEKKFDYEFDIVKEEPDPQTNGKYNTGDDHMYMQALYHALPMNYITIAKLQNKLEANVTTVRKLIDKMAQDGFVETKSNRRLGRRVIHSEKTEKKLSEVRKSLSFDAMDVDMDQNDLNDSGKKANNSEPEANGNTYKDLSTCGALHSVGSDLTRTVARSAAYPNGSIRSDDSKRMDNGNTPISKAQVYIENLYTRNYATALIIIYLIALRFHLVFIQPAASRESYAAGAENGRGTGNGNQCDDNDTIMSSRLTQEKRFRKASTVKEPILQCMKRQKSQAV
ncbi:OLC1v1028645C1 [Oldenlandia corymbosa var. corymbosa]|uniref:OLC1v1028645C1 n=1 Tax=Oldenlandia corymbosa var. corymbosa TaxID=529605 RepID=A0AAV1CC83_OLDCO|nr:OLC1v1028645C1 [Oldenlandia corymbosa var. corymbosa]